MNRWRHNRYGRRERGSIFLLAVVILFVILAIGASLVERSIAAIDRASHENRSAKSFQLAEAGVNQALWSLNQPNGWLTYDGDSNLSLATGTVDIAVSPPPSQRGVFTDTLYIISSAHLPGPNGSQRSPCTIRMITHKDPRYFAYAVFGDEQVTVGNGTVIIKTDSYTSDDGTYGGDNVGASADIGTNSTAADAIKVLPKGEIHGTISVGTGATSPELSVDNKGIITGDIVALDAPNILPSVTTIPPGTIELGDIWIDEDTEIVLDAGIYHMTDLDMFGNAQITCNGEVTLYIDATTDPTPDIRIGGNGIVNTSQIPSNLTIYCMDDVPIITISGNAAVYAGIYAPQADIILNSGEVYGSLVGKSVTLNGANSHVHYDQALRDHANPLAVMRSWEIL